MLARLEAIASRLEAIASRLEAIASRLEAIASRLEAIASRLEAIASRLEATFETPSDTSCEELLRKQNRFQFFQFCAQELTDPAPLDPSYKISQMS